MIYLKAKEFETQGTYGQNSLEILFQDNYFVEGPTFPKKHRQKAIEYCQEYEDLRRLCLLVEGSFYFTVWLEKIDQKQKKDDLRNKVNPKHQPPPAQSSTAINIFSHLRENHLQKLRAKQSQVPLHEQEEVEESATEPNFDPKATRTYRGVKYTPPSQ